MIAYFIAGGLDQSNSCIGLRTINQVVVPFLAADAELAADFWSPARGLGLSLGDRACLALASRLDRPALTADRLWLELDLGVEIQAIR